MTKKETRRTIRKPLVDAVTVDEVIVDAVTMMAEASVGEDAEVAVEDEEANLLGEKRRSGFLPPNLEDSSKTKKSFPSKRLSSSV